MKKPRKTDFLDRDGVINRHIIDDYVTDPHECVMLEGAVEAISLLGRAGYRTVVVTNQRGIAIGRMSYEAVNAVHRFIRERVAAAGGSLEEFYICPHDRDAGCECRKPAPGLLDQAHRRESVDWAASFLVGDSDSDIQAGRQRGLTTIKVAGPSTADPDHECLDLPAAAQWILTRRRTIDRSSAP